MSATVPITAALRMATACPLPEAINAHADAAEHGTRLWAARLGLVPQPASIADLHFGRLAARVYPNTGATELQLAADWVTWLFLLDDLHDQEAIGRDPRRLAELNGILEAVLDDPVPRPSEPFANALADLVRRTTARSQPASWSRLRRDVSEYLDACVWESQNRSVERVPDLDDYIAMRPATGAMLIVIDLGDITDGIELSDAARGAADLVALTAAMCNIVVWTNDVVSVDRELRHADVHNLVIALQSAQSIELSAALARAEEMVAAELSRFVALRAARSRREEPTEANVARYIAVLCSWIRGHFDWATETARYAT